MKAGVNPTRLEALLYYAAKFIGLMGLTLKGKKFHPATFWSKAYVIAVAVLLITWVYYLLLIQSDRMTTLHQVISIGSILVIATTLISSVFTFTIKSKKILNLLNQIIVISGKLRNLLVTDGCCHEGIKNNWIIKIIKSNVVVLLLVTLQVISMFDSFIFKWRLFALFGIMLLTCYVHNIILIFVQILLYVKHHFEYLNNNLQDIIIRSNSDVTVLSHDLPNRRIFMVGNRPENSNRGLRDAINEPPNVQSTVERIKKIEILHNEMTHLVDLTTRLFTMPIALIMYQNFFKLIFLFYIFWTRILSSPDGFDNVNIFVPLIFSCVSPLAITIYDIVLVAHACASTCKAGNTTRSVLDTIWNKYQPAELKDEFVMFSFQLIYKPLAILVFGFYDLGYPCLLQMFTAVISYVLVIVQLEPALQN